MAIEIQRMGKKNNDCLFVQIVQVITICNAMKEGWEIKQIGKSTYEFTKLCNDDIDLKEFINRISTF